MICPMSFWLNEKRNIVDATYCYKDECAWWNSQLNICAVLALSISFETLLIAQGGS